MTAYYDTHVPVAAAPPAKLAREFSIDERSLDGMFCWRVAPRADTSSHLIYVHGGAYVNELVIGHWAIIAGLARRTGAIVHVPRYPLAPRDSWRSAFGPMLTLVRQVRALSPAGALGIVGDSAGAGLALALCQVLRDAKEPMPDRIALLSPFLDLLVDQPEQAVLALADRMLAAPGLRWAGERWAGGLMLDDPRVSPLYGSLLGLPPILVVTGTSDLLHSDARRLRDKAKREGVPLAYSVYEAMFHVWMAAPIPEAETALDEIGRFLAA